MITKDLQCNHQNQPSTTLNAIQATQLALDTIAEKDKMLNCFITVDRDGALKRAKEVQQQIDRGELTGPLAGVPIAVKDNLCTNRLRTTCASRMLENFVPTYSATVVEKLEKAGAVILGKTNMDEFAMGSTTETSAFGETRNPHNTLYSPGGSSGGSAAAVAAGECVCALGTDTGGSVRQPASHCGIVGMKPTYGLVSRYGLVAYASSMDQVGVLTRNVSDCAAMLDIIVGKDEKDTTSVGRPAHQCNSYMECLKKDVKGMRIGIPVEYFQGDIQDEVKEAVLRAAEVFQQKGAIVEEFHLKMVEYVVPTYYVLAMAEAASNLERYDGVKYGYRAETYDGLHDMYKKTRSEAFGEEVKRRIMMGNFVLSAGYYDAYYLKALKVRRLIKQAYDEAFSRYDIILGPVAPTTAPKLGTSLQNPMQMYLSDVYTTAANLVGVPAISIPCGVDHAGLPIGVQLTGNLFCEELVLQAAYHYEFTGMC